MVITMHKKNRLFRTARVLLRRLIACEQGAMQVAEYLLMGTVITLGVIVGLVSYRNSITLEYGDVAAAVDSLDQSYEYQFTDFVGGTATTRSPVFYDDTDGTNQSNTINVTSPAGSGEQ